MSHYFLDTQYDGSWYVTCVHKFRTNCYSSLHLSLEYSTTEMQNILALFQAHFDSLTGKLNPDKENHIFNLGPPVSIKINVYSILLCKMG